MLKQRVITALVLLAILLPALFWPTAVPFSAVTLVLIAAGAWEWGRLVLRLARSAPAHALVARGGAVGARRRLAASGRRRGLAGNPEGRAGGGGRARFVAHVAGRRAGARDRRQFPAVDPGAGLGG